MEQVKTLSKIPVGGGKNKQRESNIELFRIITMLVIVAHHYVVNSGLTVDGGPIYSAPMAGASIFLLLFGAWGKIGINCFVLITGYFMCESRITARKFVKLLFEVMFYRIVIQLIFWVTGYTPVTVISVAKTFIPITGIANDFVGTYLVFFLCIPFLNILIKQLTEKQHIRLLLLSCFIYVFFGTVKLMSVTMNYVSWFIVLYFIASYIRLYPRKFFDNKKIWGWMTILSLVLSATSVIACAWIGNIISRNLAYYLVADSNTFLAVLTGVSAFLFFKNWKIKYNKFINTVSATTFGILLIHAHSDSMRQWLWKDLLNNVGFYGSVWMLVHAIGSVLGIFIVCSVIDLLRIRFIEKPFFKIWDRNWDGIARKYNDFEKRVCKKMNIQE